MANRPRQVRAGSGNVTAAQMVDSSPLLQSGQIEAARQRLTRDGYLLLRGYLPPARASVVSTVVTTACLAQQLGTLRTSGRAFLV